MLPLVLLVAADVHLEYVFGDFDQGLVVGHRTNVGQCLGVRYFPALAM